MVKSILNNTVSTNFVLLFSKTEYIQGYTYCFVAQASETVKSSLAKIGIAGPIAMAL